MMLATAPTAHPATTAPDSQHAWCDEDKQGTAPHPTNTSRGCLPDVQHLGGLGASQRLLVHRRLGKLCAAAPLVPARGEAGAEVSWSSCGRCSCQPLALALHTGRRGGKSAAELQHAPAVRASFIQSLQPPGAIRIRSTQPPHRAAAGGLRQTPGAAAFDVSVCTHAPDESNGLERHNVHVLGGAPLLEVLLHHLHSAGGALHSAHEAKQPAAVLQQWITASSSSPSISSAAAAGLPPGGAAPFTRRGPGHGQPP